MSVHPSQHLPHLFRTARETISQHYKVTLLCCWIVLKVGGTASPLAKFVMSQHPSVTHQHAGLTSAPIWWAATCSPLPCLLCYTSAELHDGLFNKDCVISAQSSESLTLSAHLLAHLPYLAALVGTEYAHAGTAGQTEGKRCHQGSCFLCSVELLK